MADQPEQPVACQRRDRRLSRAPTLTGLAASCQASQMRAVDHGRRGARVVISLKDTLVQALRGREPVDAGKRQDVVPSKAPDAASAAVRAQREIEKGYDRDAQLALRAFEFFNPDVTVADTALHRLLVERAVQLGYVGWPKKIRKYIQGKRLLDVGCGNGMHAIGYVVSGVTRYLGLDPRVNLDADTAKSKTNSRQEPLGFTPRDVLRCYPQTALVQGTFEAIAPDEIFDVAVLHNVTEHLSHLEEVIAGCVKRLAPDGRMIFNHHNYYCWNGHHLPPRTLRAIAPGDSEQQKYMDWAHLDFDPPAGHYIATGLNRVRLDELRAIVERYYDIKEWTERPSDENNGGLRLTPEIIARHPEYSERELRVHNVLCVAQPKRPPKSSQRDMARDPVFMRLYEQCKPCTMTTMERLFAVYEAVGYLVRNRIPGDIVECGVWKGGSSMMAALALAHHGDDGSRRLWLYDTFAGMPEPGPRDVKLDGGDSIGKWRENKAADHNAWNYGSLDEVRANMAKTGFPVERTVFVPGKVEETLPAQRPDRIALLRLDTDFYESTKAELAALAPLLSPGGTLIVDDYGSWAGSRQAVDEWLDATGLPLFLARSDVGGRIAVMPGLQSRLTA
jgi:2-polyprenyl-3-methyl-5-hydroxy-6-metoxy-1,4-benzoquinol methylase